MTTRKRLLSILVFTLFLSSLAMANGLNLNGFGARASAMGGAFGGLANDYTAGFFNPAGLTQLKKKTFGFTADLIFPSGTYTLDYARIGYPLPGNIVEAETVSKAYPAGYAGYYHPVNDKLVLGISVSSPSGLGAKWEGSDLAGLTGGKAFDWLSFIGVITVAPTVAYQVAEKVSVGVSLNTNYGIFSISRHAGLEPVDLGQYEEDSSGFGLGATFGILIQPSEKFSLGATFRTPSTVKMSGDTTISGLNQLGYATNSEFDRDVTSPMWIAGGFAFKPMENLTFTFDAHYTNWGSLEELDTMYVDPDWKAFMGATGGDKIKLNWADKTQLRFGVEYVLGKIALRAGYYNDPGPAPNDTFTILMPNFNWNAFTGGIGYKSNGITLNVAAEYLTGEDRDVAPAADNMPGIHGMDILTAIVGLSFEF